RKVDAASSAPQAHRPPGNPESAAEPYGGQGGEQENAYARPELARHTNFPEGGGGVRLPRLQGRADERGGVVRGVENDPGPDAPGRVHGEAEGDAQHEVQREDPGEEVDEGEEGGGEGDPQRGTVPTLELALDEPPEDELLDDGRDAY